MQCLALATSLISAVAAVLAFLERGWKSTIRATLFVVGLAGLAYIALITQKNGPGGGPNAGCYPNGPRGKPRGPWPARRSCCPWPRSRRRPPRPNRRWPPAMGGRSRATCRPRPPRCRAFRRRKRLSRIPRRRQRSPAMFTPGRCRCRPSSCRRERRNRCRRGIRASIGRPKWPNAHAAERRSPRRRSTAGG